MPRMDREFLSTPLFKAVAAGAKPHPGSSSFSSPAPAVKAMEVGASGSSPA